MVFPLLGKTLEVEDLPGMVCKVIKGRHLHIFNRVAIGCGSLAAHLLLLTQKLWIFMFNFPLVGHETLHESFQLGNIAWC